MSTAHIDAAPSERLGRAIGATDLLPPVPQTLWGWPAVLNFALGGLGAGLYAVAAVTAGFGSSPALGTVAWLSPLLVAAGFAAVAVEAGHPLRGPRVAARVATSWMSRELWLGIAFLASAPATLVAERPGWRVLATIIAVALAVAQGELLRQARGVAVWSVPPVPMIFLTSALVSGTGLLLLLEAGAARGLDRLLGVALVFLIAHLFAWSLFVGWSRDDAFVRGIHPLCRGASGLALVVSGYHLPALLAALSVALPWLAPAAAALAGTLMVAGQVAMKAALLRQAGQLRAITLPQRLRERRP